MNQSNLWATTYQNLLSNHPNANDIRFWLDALQWGKAERLGPGKVKVFLSAPNFYYANFIDSTFKNEIETAIAQVIGEACEVSIDVMKATSIDEVADAKQLAATPSSHTSPLAPPTYEIHIPSANKASSSRPSIPTHSHGPVLDQIDPNLTFDNYIVGPSPTNLLTPLRFRPQKIQRCNSIRSSFMGSLRSAKPIFCMQSAITSRRRIRTSAPISFRPSIS